MTDSGENRSNKRTFFNSMVAAYTGWTDSRNIGEKAVITGQNEQICPVFMKDAVEIMNEIRVAFKWSKGDLLLIDNRTAMHSRLPFDGTRRVLSSLVRDSDR